MQPAAIAANNREEDLVSPRKDRQKTECCVLFIYSENDIGCNDMCISEVFNDNSDKEAVYCVNRLMNRER